MTTLLDTPGDLNWLAEVHLKSIPLPLEWAGFKSAVIHGSESSPTAIDLYMGATPLVTDCYLHIAFNPADDVEYTHHVVRPEAP